VLTKFLLTSRSQTDKQLGRLIDHLQKRVIELERVHALCMAENAALHARIGVQDGEIRALKAAIVRLEAANLGAIVSADATGRIYEWNPAATSLFRWSIGQAMRMNIRELIPERFRAQHDEAFARAVTADAPIRATSLQSFALRADGTEVPVTVLLESWNDRDGKRCFQAEIRRR
jgi:PAS domain S-box-containing protein